MGHWLPWIALAGMGLIEASYLPQIARLYRLKEADEISFWFPLANLVGRLIAIIYTLSRNDHALAAGFILGVALRSVLLSQVIYYRHLRRRLGYGQGFARAIRDLASGAYNRPYVLEQLRKELAQVKRHDDAFSVLFLAVRIAEPVDEPLRLVADTLKARVRAGECFGRIEDRTFAVILRAIPRDQLAGVADRFRTAILAGCGRATEVASWPVHVDEHWTQRAEDLLAAGTAAVAAGAPAPVVETREEVSLGAGAAP